MNHNKIQNLNKHGKANQVIFMINRNKIKNSEKI